jgi:hypothetical protein
LGQLSSAPIRVETPTESVEDLSNLRRGDPFPLGSAKGKTFSVLQRDPRLIAVKSRLGVRFVVPAEKLADPQKALELRQIQDYLTELYAKGRRMSRIVVTKQGHVVCLFGNGAVFVGHAPEGAAGFIIEEK